jgi:hypothetical protein
MFLIIGDGFQTHSKEKIHFILCALIISLSLMTFRIYLKSKFIYIYINASTINSLYEWNAFNYRKIFFK